MTTVHSLAETGKKANSFSECAPRRCAPGCSSTTPSFSQCLTMSAKVTATFCAECTPAL